MLLTPNLSHPFLGRYMPATLSSFYKFNFYVFFVFFSMRLKDWVHQLSFQPWRPQVFNSKLNKARQAQQPCTQTTTQASVHAKHQIDKEWSKDPSSLLKSHWLTSLNLWSSLGSWKTNIQEGLTSASQALLWSPKVVTSMKLVAFSRTINILSDMLHALWTWSHQHWKTRNIRRKKNDEKWEPILICLNPRFRSSIHNPAHSLLDSTFEALGSIEAAQPNDTAEWPHPVFIQPG